MGRVAFLLNSEGIRTKRGGKWTARAVRDVITNELYTGNYWRKRACRRIIPGSTKIEILWL